jgi:hypothetical protein
MSTARADLGFGDELDQFDPASWTPKPRGAQSDPEAKQAMRIAAEATGFRSREPKAPAATEEPSEGRGASRLPRRRRTGRNAQFNLKARPDTIEAFIAIADRQGWGLGETLEHAVELLRREYGDQSSSRRAAEAGR